MPVFTSAISLLQAREPPAYTSGMTLKEFASLGGQARAKSMSKARRREIARIANLASQAKRKAKSRSAA